MRRSTWAASLDPLSACEIWRTSRCPPRVQEDTWTKVVCHDGSWRPHVYQACPASLQWEWSSPGKGHLSKYHKQSNDSWGMYLGFIVQKANKKKTTTRFRNNQRKKDWIQPRLWKWSTWLWTCWATHLRDSCLVAHPLAPHRIVEVGPERLSSDNYPGRWTLAKSSLRYK